MIRVNDMFEVGWHTGMTVEALLERLKFTFPLIIVSVDGALVPKEDYSTFQIADGAQVKVLHMIAGG